MTLLSHQLLAIINRARNRKIIILLDQMQVSGSNFILGIILARTFGPDLFGVYALLWMLVLFFSGLQQTLIVAPMYTLEAKAGNKIPPFDVFYLQVFYSILSVVLALCFLYGSSLFLYKNSIVYDLMLTSSLVLFLFLTQDFLRRVLIFSSCYVLVLVMDFIAYPLLIGTTFYAEWSGNLDLEYFFILLSIHFFVSAGLVFTQITIRKPSDNIINKVAQYWFYSKWLGVANVVQWFTGNLFILVASFILGGWVAGVIRIFQNIMGAFHVIFSALENVIPISAAKIYSNGGAKPLITYIKKHTLVGFLFLLISLMVIFVMTPENIILRVYGQEYIQYGYFLYWYFLIYLFIYTGMLLRFLLRTLEKTKIIFLSYLVSMVFSGFFALPLINYFGIDGVVLGTFGSQVVMLLVYLYLIRETLMKDSEC